MHHSIGESDETWEYQWVELTDWKEQPGLIFLEQNIEQNVAEKIPGTKITRYYLRPHFSMSTADFVIEAQSRPKHSM